MDTFRDQLILILTTPLYVVVIGLELVLSQFDGIRSYSWKDTVHNFYLSILRGGTELMMKGISLALLSYCFSHSLVSFPASFWYWLILLLYVDLMHYLLHRISHYCRFFWAVHVNHHSSPHYNISVGFRSAVLEPLYGYLFFIPVAFLGFQPADIFFMFALTQIWGVLTHTEKIKKLGWLEYVFVTPSHHRVHHASNPLYLDKNMGGVFIIWDKLFGTFQEEVAAETYQPIRYGLTTPLGRPGFGTIIFHEWKNIWQDIRRKDISWKDRWRYVFGPPGWSHDGTRHTSSQLREQESANPKTIA